MAVRSAWMDFVVRAQRRRPKGPGGGQFAPGGDKPESFGIGGGHNQKPEDVAARQKYSTGLGPDGITPSYQQRGVDQGAFTTKHDPLAAEAEEIRVRVLAAAGIKAKPMPTSTGTVAPTPTPTPTPKLGKSREDLEKEMKKVKKELGEIYRKNQKLGKETEEWKKNRDRQLELRKQRSELEKQGIAKEAAITSAGADTDTRISTLDALRYRKEAYEILASKNSAIVNLNLTSKHRGDITGAPAMRMAEAKAFLEKVADRDAFPSGNKIDVNSTNDRSNASPDPADLNINMDRSAPTKTYVHELGHIMETHSSSHLNAAVAFLERRTKKQAEEDEDEEGGGYSMNGLRDRTNHKSHEKGYPDHFEDAYSGKLYRAPREHHQDGDTHRYPGSEYNVYYATEITSMGLERLMANPVKFAQDDPDYFRFTVSQLRRPKKIRTRR